MSEADALYPGKLEFTGLYNLPGEGLVAEFRCGNDSLLYDRRGLQFRIVQMKQQGVDASAEERALAQINSIAAPQPIHDSPQAGPEVADSD